MAQALENLGFAVELLLDANQMKMEQAIARFSHQLRQGGVGLFYYAGHGMQLDGQNFLIPIGAELPDVTHVKYKTVHVGLVLDQMKAAGNALNIVILDACRDNPFQGRGRSAQRGLAVVQAALGSLIAYATGPGDIALDGRERNGVYTKYLLRYISQPQLSIEQMFKYHTAACVSIAALGVVRRRGERRPTSRGGPHQYPLHECPRQNPSTSRLKIAGVVARSQLDVKALPSRAQSLQSGGVFDWV
jgi:uncharacterized caspase-like protein